MGALSAFTPNRLGVVTNGNAVAASDTIAAALIGTKGAILEITNGNAAPDNMTISDASSTPTGAAAAPNAPVVTNGTNKAFLIRPEQVHPVSNDVTITHSVTSSVTYKLYSIQ